MNSAAVNQVAVNDSNEIWSWYGDDANIVMQATGALAIGLSLTGAASIQLQSTATAYMRAIPPFTPAAVTLAAAGEVAYGVTGSGQAQVVLTSTGNGTRRVMGAGITTVEVLTEGDAQVVAPATASFTIEFDLALDERITPAIPGEGVSQIRVTTTIADRRATPIWLESENTKVEVATIGYPRLILKSPAGSAALRLAAIGEARLGERIQLQPMPAELSLYARGELGFRHYVYGEGQCSIAVQSKALSHGRPQIPTDYIPAPAIRLLRVDKDNRRFIVSAERRL